MNDKTVIKGLALLVIVGWCSWANEIAKCEDLRRDLVELQRITSECEQKISK